MFGIFTLFSCNDQTNKDDIDIEGVDWIQTCGAKSYPKTERFFSVHDYGAVGNGIDDDTRFIQEAIDICAESGGGIVTFAPGKYITGALYVKSGVNLNVPKGTTLLGSQDINHYPKIDTRVAGIEMKWPSALINIIDQENAAISGDGTIDARGKIFWDKYYEMRKEYSPKKLRWIVDYDCERPRGILISDSKDITVKDIVLYQPGFWSLHILYSEYVTVDNVIISNNIEGKGPSTDGIDIDSSQRILVKNSYINCNDDNFCLKAGRDADGLRVNRPCEYIVIRDCVAGHGDGLFTCGSETSGGIRNVVAYNLKGVGTKYGLRFKSTMQRGGVIEDIYLKNITMDNVKDPFVVDLNWHPSYSNSVLPDGYDRDSVPGHWKTMLEKVNEEAGIPTFRNVIFENITASGASTCIKVKGNERSRIDGFVFRNVTLNGDKAGSINWAKGWRSSNFVIEGKQDNTLKIENCESVFLR